MSDSLHIFILEPDQKVANQMDKLLVKSGYEVFTFATSIDILTELKMKIPSLLILGRSPRENIDGAEICRTIRDDKRLRSLPIVLTSHDLTDKQEVYALEMGVDSVIGMPCSDELFLAKIRSLMRRCSVLDELYDAEPYIKVRNLYIDTDKHEVFKDNVLIKMTYKEFELLYTLAKHKGQVLTRETLLYQVWGYTYAGETRTVDVHIRSIRKLLGDFDKTYIETVRGLGYKFNDGE